MTASAELRVLFRAPAGPRRGFGHLVRCRSLARALGVRPLIALRGGATVRRAARALGCDVIEGAPAAVLARVGPHVLIVDDPIASDARRWIACARRSGCPVATVHDLGLGACEGDLVVDGSVVVRSGGSSDPPAKLVFRTFMLGPRFALLDPVFASARHPARRPRAPRVLISLGGGPRAVIGDAIARVVKRELPWASIRIAGGFASAPGMHAGGVLADAPPLRNPIVWTGPLDGLAAELAACDVAVVGGGVSLYEACASGVAAVGVAVVASQRPTVKGFAAAGAALGHAAGSPDPERIAGDVVRLLLQPALRLALAARGRKLVDGKGAGRVAEALVTLARRRRVSAGHAAAAARRAS
jgi:spore coat polysaccharide biosynthesis predicted glycosyltransferase SpsG